MTSRSPQPDGPQPAPFQVIPAVDLLGEEAVRLEKGAFDRVTIRAGSPDALVRKFAAESPGLIHIVDLEGARDGRVRPDVIRRLVQAAAGIPIQASGGIRSVDDASSLLDAGAARVIVGTAAFATEDALSRFAESLGEQLMGRFRGTWEGIDPAKSVPRWRTERYRQELRTVLIRELWWTALVWGPFYLLVWAISGFRSACSRIS